MELTFIELITKYGLNAVVIASLVFVVTGLVKIPIKAIAKKIKDGSRLTKYITFLPIVFGFLLTVLYRYVVVKSPVFDASFFALWLTSSSLSLAIYSFKEKFFPGKSKLTSIKEIKQNEEIIEKIRDAVLPQIACETCEKDNANNKVEEMQVPQKIILRVGANVKAKDE